MKLKIRYFASLREQTGIATEEIQVDAACISVAELQNMLGDRNAALAAAFSTQKSLRVAVDFHMCGPDVKLTRDCEVAFFPPVTGG